MAEAEKSSDEQKGSDEQRQKAEAEAAKSTRSYSVEEFKEVVSQRQELKERLRVLEEAENKRTEEARAAAEKKAIEEGKMKEVLDAREKELQSLKAKAEAYEEQQQKLRKNLMSQLGDETDKKVAKEIANLDTLQEFVDARKKDKTEPYGGKGSVQAPGIDIKNFKGSYDDLVEKLRSAGIPVEYGDKE